MENPPSLRCLTMIVKNEEHVIERCLRSAAPFIHTYCICDNGSTDRTKQIIKDVMDELGISGVIHDHEWLEFGPTRTLSLEASRAHCPDAWSWVIDADDQIQGTPPSEDYWKQIPPNTTHINVKIVHGSLVHYRPQLFNNKFPWTYKGRVHEVAHLPNHPQQPLILDESVWHKVACEGARSKDPLKFVRDAERCKLDYLDDPKNGRAIYYMAQSYRDAGLHGESIKWFKLRAEIYDQSRHEQYLSCVEIIHHSEDIKEQLQYTWRAVDIDNTRLEAPEKMLNIAVRKNYFTSEVLAIGQYVTNREMLPEHVFARCEVYNWRFADSYSVVLYWKGKYRESAIEASKALSKCPPGQTERIRKNLEFALKKS